MGLPRRPLFRLWRQVLPTPTTRRGAAVIGAYYALYLAPVAVGIAFDASRMYWLASGLASATVVVHLCAARGFARVAALAVNMLSTVVNALLMISLILQGAGVQRPVLLPYGLGHRGCRVAGVLAVVH